MLVGFYKNKKFYFNQFYMEIYEEGKDGRLIKKRDFSKWESLINWKSTDNILASEIIKKYNKKYY